MKLDMNCVRDIMLTIESQSSYLHMPPDDFCKLLPQYDRKEILYCCEKLYEGGYLHIEYIDLPNSSQSYMRAICDLTFSGHEFLSDIKPPSNWEKLSSFLNQGGSASLKVISNVAISIATEALRVIIGL